MRYPILPATPAAAIGLLVAQVGIAAAFTGPTGRFWGRMTATGAGLAAVSLLGSGSARSARAGGRDVAIGLGTAAALCAVSGIGDGIARRTVPAMAKRIDEVYERGRAARTGEVAARLVLVGAAEELFWRGLVVDALRPVVGRWPAAALSTAAYAAAHLSSGNPVLVGAALAGGGYWASLRATGVPMGSLVVDHVAWDLWMFLGPGAQRTRPAACSGT